MIKTVGRPTSMVLAALAVVLLGHAQSRQPGGIDDRTNLGWATDNAGTYLTADATSAATTWTVADTSSLELDNILTVVATGEKVHVTAISPGAPGTLTVVRHVGGTTAQAIIHGNTDTTGNVECDVNSTYWNNMLDAMNKTQLNLASVAALGHPALELNGTPTVPRNLWNLIPGTGITITCPDNSGAGSTDCTLSAPGAGGSGFAIQVDGAAQTVEPTVSFDHGAGISLTPSVASGVLHVAVAATGSGAGNKAAYAAFSAAGCAGGSTGSAIDLPSTGGPSPVNHNGTTLIVCTLDFTSGTNQSAQIHFTLPGDFAASSVVSLQLTWFSSVGSSSSTIWSAKTACPTESAPLTGTVAWNSAGTVTTANNTVPGSAETSILPSLSTSGCSGVAGGSVGTEMWIMIQRTDSALGTVSLVSASVAVQRTY